MTASVILQTKLNAPPLRANLVRRSRLIAKLAEEKNENLILICAPAGYGKTTLATEWLMGLQNKFAWLSLDESDNDPRRFLDYFLAALRQVETDVGRTVEAMLQSPQPPPSEAILTALINEIASIAQPFVLVLDDYHVIHSPPIHAQLNFLLEHQPRQMRLLVITREDPPLPLPRLRARGQMTEIRQNDIRFSPEECADFLQRVMGLALSSEDVNLLERHTEGWIAGLQLAALSMQGHQDVSGFIQAFTGSSRFILDYLLDEVFERQSPPVKDFLLKTSVLERMCASLCDAIIGSQTPANSREILEHLERSNLFIIPLDQSRVWYRYHHLFSELLQQRLQLVDTFSQGTLHRLASQWFAREGLLPEAIHHSLAGGDWDLAADLIAEQSIVMLRRGEMITLLGWLKAIPDTVIRFHWNLCRDYGWALTLTGQFDAAIPYLDYAERATQDNKEQLGQVMVAQAYLARARGDHQRAILLSEQALERIAETDILHRGLVMFTWGFALFKTGLFSDAETVLLEACTAARLSGNDYIRQTALGLLGAIQSDQGRLHKAYDFYNQALQEANGSPTAAQAQVLLADILYEWNDLEAAADQLAHAVKASRYIGGLATELDACCEMIRLNLAQGDISTALETLDEIHRLASERNFPLAGTYTSILHAEIALAQGDLTSAHYWVRQMTNGLDTTVYGLNYQANLLQSKLLLAEGKRSEAGTILAGMYESVSKLKLAANMIEIRSLQAVAAEHPKDALRFLREVLTMAEPEGFIRTIIDRGEPMKFLLERLKVYGGEWKEYVLKLLSAFGEKTAPESMDQPLIEPMSERELEILRLLADGLSNREIAQKLVITVGTAKSHVHHILEKVGAESRMQATVKAREMGLL